MDVLNEFALEGKYGIMKTKKGYRIYSKDLERIPWKDGDTIGILAVRTNGKPTTFLSRLVKGIPRLEVSIDELKTLVNGESIPCRASMGWIVVSYNNTPIGPGRCGKKLTLEIPKVELARIREVMGWK